MGYQSWGCKKKFNLLNGNKIIKFKMITMKHFSNINQNRIIKTNINWNLLLIRKAIAIKLIILIRIVVVIIVKNKGEIGSNLGLQIMCLLRL